MIMNQSYSVFLSKKKKNKNNEQNKSLTKTNSRCLDYNSTSLADNFFTVHTLFSFCGFQKSFFLWLYNSICLLPLI